ncbi:MAG: transposase, partial [Candidatus Cybelea sp.]
MPSLEAAAHGIILGNRSLEGDVSCASSQRSGEAKRVFPNTSKGFEQLTAWLKNRHAADVHICMEATGAYWEALAVYLHELKHRVSVVNPARIKAFAQSELLRTKTDAVDAALIARFCRSQVPEAWIPPAPEIR